MSIMTILENTPLAGLTTFRIGGPARFFAVALSVGDVAEAFAFARQKNLPVFILGGGSNILVGDKGFDGLVLKIEIKGIEEVKSEAVDGSFAYIRAGAGENWDEFVAWTVARGWGGLENLSLIPGTVGAAPVQNIGAYGVEAADLIEGVEAFDTSDSTFKRFSRDECGFSYRDSVFKREKGRYVIVSILFKLEKDSRPDISYRDVREYFEKKGQGGPGASALAAPSIALVRDAVVSIRTAKLPDVKKVGTAGSFWKNPIVSKKEFDELKAKYPELPSYPQADGRIKVPAAWIIDKVCGLKGKSWGMVGIHDTQALVIVNNGGASSEQIEKVAREVENAVQQRIGIEIEREVVTV